MSAFAEFWTIYPRKVGKPKALVAYRRALRRASAAEILEGARRLRDDPNREDGFTPHPTTWLNRDGWDDGPLPPRLDRPRRPPDPPRPLVGGEGLDEWRSLRES